MSASFSLFTTLLWAKLASLLYIPSYAISFATDPNDGNKYIWTYTPQNLSQNNLISFFLISYYLCCFLEIFKYCPLSHLSIYPSFHLIALEGEKNTNTYTMLVESLLLISLDSDLQEVSSLVLTLILWNWWNNLLNDIYK